MEEYYIVELRIFPTISGNCAALVNIDECGADDARDADPVTEKVFCGEELTTKGKAIAFVEEFVGEFLATGSGDDCYFGREIAERFSRFAPDVDDGEQGVYFVWYIPKEQEDKQ